MSRDFLNWRASCHTATLSHALQRTAMRCKSATHWNLYSTFTDSISVSHLTLQCTVMQCNMLEHAAMHCNILQYTVRRCHERIVPQMSKHGRCHVYGRHRYVQKWTRCRSTIHECDKTHAHAWQHAITRVTQRIHTAQNALTCVTRLIHICDTTYSLV